MTAEQAIAEARKRMNREVVSDEDKEVALQGLDEALVLAINEYQEKLAVESGVAEDTLKATQQMLSGVSDALQKFFLKLA